MRLIDADKLKEKKEYSEKRHEYIVSVAQIDWQPTIQPQGIDKDRLIELLNTDMSGCDGDFAEEMAEIIIANMQHPTTDGWIPVSERLPNQEEFLKDDGRVIVTDGCRVYQSCYDIYSRCFRTVKLFNFYEHGRIADFKHDKRVIAWQPLPQPHKE